MQLNPYLEFNGQCEEAFRFYERCLGGKIVAMFTHADTPMEGQTPPEWRNKIMHARLIVGDKVLMGSDMPKEHSDGAKGFSISVGVDDPQEAEKVFHALAEGGKVRMPIAETFWAHRFGMLEDRFGIPWMVNCEKAVQA